MATRPDILTRRRYLAHIRDGDETLVRLNDEAFTKWGFIRSGTDKMADHLDPAAIRADREGLNSAAKPVLEYAQPYGCAPNAG